MLSISSNDPYKPHTEIPINANVSDIDELYNDVCRMPTLLGNFPNPFNPETVIRFSVACRDDGLPRLNSKPDITETRQAVVSTKITIYNIRGQLVRKLVDDLFAPGEHSVIWNGTDDHGLSVGSGVYLYRMQTDDFTSTKKMVLIK